MRLVGFFHGGLGAVAESDLFGHNDVQNHFQRAALVRFGKNWQTLAELFVRALPLLIRGAHFLAGDGDRGAIDILHRELKSQEGFHQRDVAVHDEMRAFPPKHGVFFAENVKDDVASDALVTLLRHAFKSERMPVGCARFKGHLDSRFPFHEFGAAAVGARLLVNNATAIAHWA